MSAQAGDWLELRDGFTNLYVTQVRRGFIEPQPPEPVNDEQAREKLGPEHVDRVVGVGHLVRDL